MAWPALITCSRRTKPILPQCLHGVRSGMRGAAQLCDRWRRGATRFVGANRWRYGSACTPGEFDATYWRKWSIKLASRPSVGRSNAVAAIGAYWANPHEATQSELEMLEAMADSAGMALGV